jgi:hypothetical protein
VAWTYHLTAKAGASGVVSLTLSDVQVADAEGNAVTGVNVGNGQVSVGGTGGASSPAPTAAQAAAPAQPSPQPAAQAVTVPTPVSNVAGVGVAAPPAAQPAPAAPSLGGLPIAGTGGFLNPSSTGTGSWELVAAAVGAVVAASSVAFVLLRGRRYGRGA